MERNTVTTLDALSIGDRFYRQSDKAKTVMEVKAIYIRHGSTVQVSVFPATNPDNPFFARKVSNADKVPVVFLRHT